MESPLKGYVLKGKVAVLTGGGSGIGCEISTQFGRHGASVAIMSRRQHVLDASFSALQSQGIQPGGGASLELLEGKPLPGVLALNDA